ncbi:MAG: hypothetical protein KAJ39_01300 [Gammaproteobacteria bacterium]|nr:hypothetical protein [Gammaproteobacteria bacterium]
MNIEETINKINELLDSGDGNFNPHDVMQLSQAALNLAHAKGILHEIKRTPVNKT